MPLAVALSIALHVLIVQLVPDSMRASDGDVQSALLTVRLAEMPEAPPAAASVIAPESISDPSALSQDSGAVPPVASLVVSRQAPVKDELSGRRRGVEPAAPLTAEPTYYGLREIDVYPEPMVPLRLPPLETPGDARGANTVRMEIFIEEHGVVTDVALRESGDLSRGIGVVQRMVLATRFHPARRSGYPVASRVEIEVRYWGLAPPGELGIAVRKGSAFHRARTSR